MKRKPQLKALVFGLMLGLSASQMVFAQSSTTAGVTGRVTDPEGRPVAGAQVEVLHVPSNTRKTLTTDDQGRYITGGLRVGGPYEVTVIKDGYEGAKREGVQLPLGETATFNFAISDAATTLESVVVVGTGGAMIFDPSRTGAGTTISGEQIQALPSIRRDLQDYARLDPRISQTDKERSEISALGQNSRFNSITIDSVSINDTFGLESNNLPTDRQPVSLDAIEEVQLNIANYDVAQRGYTGANINAVTKSGTNSFRGSVYGTYRDGDWVREKDDRGIVFNGFDKEYSYGFTLGGPILEDRLFFFLNYDKTKIKAPGPDLGVGPIGRGTITQAQVAEVVSIAQGFGVTAGDLNTSGLETEVETFLGRIDWNIADGHRAAFRFSMTDESRAILPGFGVNFFSLSSYWYTQEKEFDNYVVELFSDWSANFSTEIRASYRDYYSEPKTFARQPQVQVNFGTSNFRFGTEQFRHANLLETKTRNLYAAGNYFMGDHEIKFGVDHEDNDIFNLFLESNFGIYTFANVDAFRTGNYLNYLYRRATSGNLNDAAADWTLKNTGFFLQDTWRVNSNLTVQFGFRWDKAKVPDRPEFNQLFLDRFGLRNDVTIDGDDLFQPRVGFNYTFDHERPTQLRGGVGLFQGAAANVWLSNPFTNNGRTITIFGCGTGGFAACPANKPPFSGNPDAQPEFAAGAGPASDVDLIQDGLSQPAIWKFNLALDHELPWWGAIMSAEAIITDVKTGIYYEHLNVGQVQSVGPDGRNLYWANTNPSNYNAAQNRFNAGTRTGRIAGFNEVLLAKESGKGKGENYILSLTKPMNSESNLFWQVAYAYTDADEVNPLTSSRAISSWRSHAILNQGENVASRSAYVNKDRFTGALSYRHFFFDAHKTEFSVFYEGRRGKPYSWVFNNDANGDNQAGNDLMYIPNGPGDVLFTDPSEAEAFFRILREQGLDRFAGRTVPRNSDFSPWVHNFDLRISQDLPGFFPDNKAQIYLDVLNVGNLLNKKWGHIDEIFFQSDGGQARSFVNFAGIDPATGRYIYDLINVEQFGRRDNRGESRWAVQLGFRYEF